MLVLSRPSNVALQACKVSQRSQCHQQIYSCVVILFNRLRWLRGRVFAWGTGGCGFDPEPRHTKSRYKIVQAALEILLK